MKVENVHLGRVCAAVVIAPPYSLPLTHWGDSASFPDSGATTNRFIEVDYAYSWKIDVGKTSLP
jgi:hypothetical protein